MHEVLKEVLAEHFEVATDAVRQLSNDIHSDGPIYGFEIVGRQEATFVYAQIGSTKWLDAEFQLHLPELGTWIRLWRFPNDPYLEGLALVAVKPAFHTLLKKIEPRFEIRDIKNVSYRPGKRAVFRVSTNLGEFFTKVTTKNNAARIVEIQQALQGNINTAELIGMANGDILIFRRMLGDDFLQTDIDPNEIVAGMHQFHDSLRRIPIELEAKRKVISNPEWYVSLLQSRFDDETLEIIQNSVQSQLEYPDNASRRCIHGDFHLGQLKFQSSPTFGVLDFDNAGLGFLAEDQSALLASCFFGMVINQGNFASAKYAHFLHAWISSLDPQENLSFLRQLTARHIVAFLASFPAQIQTKEHIFIEFLRILAQEDESFLILTSSLLHSRMS